MTNQSMELFEMQNSKQEEKEDTKIDQNLFIRKILLYAFTEYYVTFIASFGLEYLPSYIPFYCCVPLSFGFQIYFEFQVEMNHYDLLQITFLEDYLSYLIVFAIFIFGIQFVIEMRQLLQILFIQNFYLWDKFQLFYLFLCFTLTFQKSISIIKQFG